MKIAGRITPIATWNGTTLGTFMSCVAPTTIWRRSCRRKVRIFPFFSQYFCPIQSADRLIEICFTFLETCFFKMFFQKYLKYVSLFWKLCIFKHIRPIRFDLEHGHCQDTMVGPRGQSVDVYVALLFSNDPTQTHRARALQVSECYTCWWYSLCNLKY